MKRFKIAIYSGVIPSTTFIENLIKAVVQENFEVHLYGYEIKKTSYSDFRIKHYNSPKYIFTLIIKVMLYAIWLRLKSNADYLKLNRYVKNKKVNFQHGLLLYSKYLPIIVHRPDIFHIQWVKGCEEWMFLKELFGIKIIVSLRGTHINISPVVEENVAKTYKSIFPEIDGFHVVSKAIFHLAVKYGANPEKINVIYSGVDFDKIKLFEKKDFSISSPLKIISVGRVHWTKGYNYALDGLRLLLEENIDFHYTIITDSLPQEIAFQIVDCELEHRVKVNHIMPQNEVFRALQNADILLLPSIEEGVANVVIEAMALGLPVVSSNCGGMVELIDHGINGYLFKNRDPEDMMMNIKTVISLSNEKRSEISSAAKQKTETLFTMKQLGFNIKKLYDNILCG